MSLILSIETSGEVCSVALHAASRLGVTHTLHVKQSHATSLVPLIDHVVAISPYTKKDLAAVAVSSGPGSYTGLRIGTATAKGLCYALGIPLIAVNTLEAMVHGIKRYSTLHALLCPMLDARNMAVYCLLADGQGHNLVDSHAQVVAANSFATWLQTHEIIFFGDGSDKCQAIITHPHARFIAGCYPTACAMGDLAYASFQRSEFVNLDTFAPLYLKPSQSR